MCIFVVISQIPVRPGRRKLRSVCVPWNMSVRILHWTTIRGQIMEIHGNHGNHGNFHFTDFCETRLVIEHIIENTWHLG